MDVCHHGKHEQWFPDVVDRPCITSVCAVDLHLDVLVEDQDYDERDDLKNYRHVATIPEWIEVMGSCYVMEVMKYVVKSYSPTSCIRSD